MSDIFAMGGIPKTALSFLSYNCNTDNTIIRSILEGAIKELNDENCILLGGHTVEENELKCGFAITGIIEDNIIYRNNTLNVNDCLILTKKIGTGIISTAIKGNMASSEAIKDATESMIKSNAAASKIMKNYNISACTDVTGFSLIGHLHEMIQSKDLSIGINLQQIPLLTDVLDYVSKGLIPGGAYRNKNFLEPFVDLTHLCEDYEMVLFDPQTSGGFIIGIPEGEKDLLLKELLMSGYSASIIGQVTEKKNREIYFI